MTTTDPFAEAAHTEAEEYGRENAPTLGTMALTARAHLHGAEWARDHLAAQEPTDAECLAVLNVAMVPLGEPPKRNGLADWNPAAVERVRAALSAARAARRDEETGHDDE